MTQAELYTALKTLGMPVAYGEFVGTPENPAPPPPFITYQFAYSGDLFADDMNAEELSNFQVELYTATKDLAREAVVQDKLKELGLPYSKIETWLDEEKMRQVVYE
ncbi:MAG: hypothetical protein ACYC21_14665, partial [Eubacteriales bacterium]